MLGCLLVVLSSPCDNNTVATCFCVVEYRWVTSFIFIIFTWRGYPEEQRESSQALDTKTGVLFVTLYSQYYVQLQLK